MEVSHMVAALMPTDAVSRDASRAKLPNGCPANVRLYQGLLTHRESKIYGERSKITHRLYLLPELLKATPIQDLAPFLKSKTPFIPMVLLVLVPYTSNPIRDPLMAAGYFNYQNHQKLSPSDCLEFLIEAMPVRLPSDGT